MRTCEELKQQLIQIRGNNYVVTSEINVDGLIADMLKFIGHTDAELRDELIYSTINTLTENMTFSTAQVKHILTTCLGDEHLFFNIGDKDTDSVFTRAFSSLPISVALWLNQNKTPFLTADELNHIKDTVLRYIKQEKDYRGYVDGKGWAHAIAHIADALGHLAEASKTADGEGEFSLGRDCLLEILDAVKNMICIDYVYTAEEDERLVVPVMDVIYREILANEELIQWIDGFNMADTAWRHSSYPGSYNRHINCKHFMRSLYFKLLSDGDYDVICKHMLEFLVESDD